MGAPLPVGARRPNWASSWEYEGVGESLLEESVSLAKVVGLLNVTFCGGDGDDHTILLVHVDKVHVDIANHIDYGQGYLTVRGQGSAFVIDASVENLSLRRVEMTRHSRCGASEWGIIRLRYDIDHHYFVEEKQFCVPGAGAQRV